MQCRLLAIEGLADLFNKYTAPFWRQGKPLGPDGRKTAFIPKRLVWSTAPAREMAVLVDHMYDNQFLGEKCSISERISCLVAMWMAMKGDDINARAVFLAKVLKPKRDTQQLIRRLTDLQHQIKAAAKNDNVRLPLIHKRTTVITYLKPLIIFDPQEGTLKEFQLIMTDILEARDNNIIRFLEMLANPMLSLMTIRNASSELTKAVARIGGTTSSSTADNDDIAAAAEKRIYQTDQGEGGQAAVHHSGHDTSVC